ncbi:MAG: N-acetyltransferase [Candidatus Zixiibacteriota bacterium]|nr:MAG: N-acetyltransferase [candidate division Zixibacteria bacterium]
MSRVEVVEVESSAQLKRFIRFPMRLYRDDPNYVAPLLVERKEFFDPDKNPFFRSARVKYFLAERDGQVVGRVATCINYLHNNYHQEKTGFFGFLDTIDEQEVASMLLKVAMITLKKEGMERMRGPMNFSTNHECGFLVEGFDSPPVVMMTYNKPYQVKLAEAFGLKKVMDLLAFQLTKEVGIPPRIRKVVEKLRQRSGISIRSINMSDFDREIDRVHQVYNEAWAYNWGFVPMDKEEFVHMAAQMKQIIDPALVLIAEDGDRPVGFSLALPDINQALIHLNGRLFPFGLLKLLWHTKIRSKIDTVRLVTFGVVPDHQKRGIDSMLYFETFERGLKRGYTRAELSWILETNELMIEGVRNMGAREYKRYRILEMPL